MVRGHAAPRTDWLRKARTIAVACRGALAQRLRSMQAVAERVDVGWGIDGAAIAKGSSADPGPRAQGLAVAELEEATVGVQSVISAATPTQGTEPDKAAKLRASDVVEAADVVTVRAPDTPSAAAATDTVEVVRTVSAAASHASEDEVPAMRPLYHTAERLVRQPSVEELEEQVVPIKFGAPRTMADVGEDSMFDFELESRQAGQRAVPYYA